MANQQQPTVTDPTTKISGPSTGIVYGQLGSISTGTLKTEDLLSVFTSTLYELARLRKQMAKGYHF